MNYKTNKMREFFWRIAGSDIEILKKCPSDQNRHANIGLAIVTTTIVAFVIGCIAGNRFIDDRSVPFSPWAIPFGFLWSLVVFTIDRNMVLTFKKRANQKRRNLIIPLLYRAFLSGLISFFISIPLELWIFKKEIETQMNTDKINQVLYQDSIRNLSYAFETRTREVGLLRKESDQLNAEINTLVPNDNVYKILDDSTMSIKTKYDNELNKYRDRVELRIKHYQRWLGTYVNYEIKDSLERVIEYQRIQIKDIPDKEKFAHKYTELEAYQEFLPIFRRTQNKKRPFGVEYINLQDLEKEYLARKSKRDNYASEYKRKKINLQKEKDSIRLIKEQSIILDKQKEEEEGDDFEKGLKKNTGFVRQWIALINTHAPENDSKTNSEKFWVGFFIWFLRVIFFTIELLPTMAKFLTPMGIYDQTIEIAEKDGYELGLYYAEHGAAFYDQEKNARQEANHALNEASSKEFEKIRQEGLANLEENILKLYFEKQNNLANKIMSKWEDDELKKI